MYKVRKAVDNFLYSMTVVRWGSHKLDQLIPSYQESPFFAGRLFGWLPLYVMITFRPDINYAAAVGKARQQTKYMLYATWVTISFLVAMLGRSQWPSTASDMNFAARP